MFNILIIGGMAAGCKAAARLSRLSAENQITIIEKSGFISVSRCGLPQFISGEIDNIYELTKTPYGIKRDSDFFGDFEGINVVLNTEATEINPWKKEITCADQKNNKSFRLKYDALILATGCKAKSPAFPTPHSSRVINLHSIDEVISFRAALQKGSVKKAVVIGGGGKGCTIAESLVSLWGIETIIIETEDYILSSSIDIELSKHIENQISPDKILSLLSTSVKKIETDINELPVVFLDNGQKIVSDYVICCTELIPETKLAEKTNIKLGISGGIIVDENMRTSIPDIWAAGDCTEVNDILTGKPCHNRDGSIATRLGRAAADSVCGRRIGFKGTVSTISLRLFESNICCSGLTEKEARKSGINTESVIGVWSDRADFHPDVQNIIGKLVYQKPGLKLIGLQLVGSEQVLRYIDVFNELLKEKRTVNSLICHEHAFNPAHSTPISPLNYLGYMVVNQEKDGIINYNPLNLPSFKGIFVDVREKPDADSKPLKVDALNIPFSGIRNKLKDFDIDQEIIFICTKGGRSYESARLFANNGFKHVAYLGGGSLLLNDLNKVIKFEEAIS